MKIQLLLIIMIVVASASLKATELSVAQQLIDCETYESKKAFYENSTLTLDEVKSLLDRTEDDRSRLEMLLFFLKKQFRFDISIGQNQAKEALALARAHDLRLQEAMALGSIATSIGLYVPSETAHSYADSALLISDEIEDYVLKSATYYTKYVIDLINEDNVSGVSNLLKCVDLAIQYGSQGTKNERMLRLMTFALENNHSALVESLLKKMEGEDFNLENQLQYLENKGEFYESLGNHDSAKVFYDQAISLRSDFETCFVLGKWYKNNEMPDSAVFFITKAIDLMDPRQSYIGDRYLELVEIYEEQGKYELALDYLKKRLEESIRLVEKSSEAQNYFELASFYQRRRQLDSANHYANLSYVLAKNRGFENSLLESTQILYQLAEGQNQFKLANKYLKEHLNQAKLNNELQVATQLKKAEIDAQVSYWIQIGDEKVKRAEQLRNLTIVITVLLLLFLITVWSMFVDKRKALVIQEGLNKKVVEQNKKIAQQGDKLKDMNNDLSETNNALEKKVSERTTELKEANDKLTQYSSRLEEYANITAHNLRGPLVNIMGLANVYGAKSLSREENILLVKMINKSAGQIDEVMRELNTLLDVERTDEIKREKISMINLISGLEVWIREKAKNTVMSFTGRTDLNEVYSVKPYLERTLRELLINSYHYRDHERALDINLTVNKKAGNMEIKVEDNGMGIDLIKHGAEIFNLNQRFHERNGRGVGLYLVKRQVEAMQGTVSVNSTPGKGACFTVSLPQDINPN